MRQPLAPRPAAPAWPFAGLAAACALALAAPALALADPAAPGRLTPAQWQKIFPEFRQLALRDTRARLTILQTSERCTSAAGNGDALRACMRQERRGMQQQRAEHRTAVRNLFERNGLPMPQWRSRPMGPGGPGPDGGV